MGGGSFIIIGLMCNTCIEVRINFIVKGANKMSKMSTLMESMEVFSINVPHQLKDNPQFLTQSVLSWLTHNVVEMSSFVFALSC